MLRKQSQHHSGNLNKVNSDCFLQHKVWQCVICIYIFFFCRVISRYTIHSKFELRICVYFSAEVLYWCKYSAFWWNPIVLWLHEKRKMSKHWCRGIVYFHLVLLHCCISKWKLSTADCSNQNLIQADVEQWTEFNHNMQTAEFKVVKRASLSVYVYLKV